MSYAPSIDLKVNLSENQKKQLTHRAMIAFSEKKTADQLSELCLNHGVYTSFCTDAAVLSASLVKERFSLVFIENILIKDEFNTLIADLQNNSKLDHLFIVVYSATELKSDKSHAYMGANAVMSGDFSNYYLSKIFKRAYSLPKQIWMIASIQNNEFILSLQQMGYDVIVTKGLLFDDSSIKNIVPDLIICDHKPQGTNAIEIHDQIKENKHLNGLPFLITFSGRDVGEIEKIIKHNIGDILLSPYVKPQNLKKIQDCCPLTPRGRRLRALVVDDSPTIRSLIVAKFKELDYQVETAINGFEGYKAVERFKPDIITSDYDMPVLNGWQFCTEVRDHEVYKDIPIIMITTRATELDLKKGELLGVSAYLTKPFTRHELKIAIDKAVLAAKTKKENELIAKFVASDTLKAVNNMIDNRNYSDQGEEKFITILFSDICGFSDKCERHSARKIIKLLNSYFDLMVEILTEHGAIIDKFIGDAIVARFDSGNQIIDAQNAAIAAWHMQEKLLHFNLDSFEEIKIRIGINSGQVILGNLGSSRHRLEYAMVGDNVNIGQRLESSAPNSKCMVSESTYLLAKDKIIVGEKNEIKVKGKSEPVIAYVIEGLI
jgi:adenylate cyclase